jgi:hypothetical protein
MDHHQGSIILLKRLTYENTPNDVVGTLESEFKRNLIRKVLSLICREKNRKLKNGRMGNAILVDFWFN